MSMKSHTDIPLSVRNKVKDRDSIDGVACCIYCGSPYGIEIAHFVPRSKGGMGKETNLACLCRKCHSALDNGADTQKAKDIKETFRYWLMRNYPDWEEEKQIYRKG